MRGFARNPEPTVCEGCSRDLPVSAFTRYLKIAGDLDADTAPAQLCDHCATYGPPSENPLLGLSVGEIEALQILAAGGSMRRAAEAAGVDQATLRARLEGRSGQRHVMREAFRALLLQAGITPKKITTAIADAFGAMTEKGAVDHNVRLKAADRATRLLELEERHVYTPKAAFKLGAHGGAARGMLFFETTLGDGTTPALEEAYQVGPKLVGAGRGERREPEWEEEDA